MYYVLCFTDCLKVTQWDLIPRMGSELGVVSIKHTMNIFWTTVLHENEISSNDWETIAY